MLSLAIKLATQTKRLGLRASAHLKLWRNMTYICGPKVIQRQLDDCIVVSMVKDGEAYLNTFVEYYLKLGIKHIILMDNGSQDKTIEIARQYPQVTVVQCLLPYKDFRHEMRHYLVERYSFNRWCLAVDYDEFFDYPYSHQLPITQLIQYLNQRGFNAVLTQMLDMYPQSSVIGESTTGELLNFRDHHCWFEIKSLTQKPVPSGLENQLSNPEINLYSGGVRARVFSASPAVSKFSLLKPGFWLRQVGHHLVSWAKVADISTVLFHYKFLPQFADRVEQAVAEQQYYQGSAEYKQYQQVLAQQPMLSFYHPDYSVKLDSVDQLVDLGFLVTSLAYQQFVSAHAQQTDARET